ncbi:MAG: hypothetical protein WCK51_10075 [Armatimonadota bacterium]
MIASLAILSLSPVTLTNQDLERTNDPTPVATGAVATLQISSAWIKVDGKWNELPDGYYPTNKTIGGKSYKARGSNLRFTATGFKFGSRKFATLNLLSYDDIYIPKSGGWVLDAPTVKLLSIVSVGPIAKPPALWNQAQNWAIPSIATRALDFDAFADYWEAYKGSTFVAVDNYIKKSTCTLYTSFMNKLPETIVWPVFPAKPKAGPVVRIQLPTEAGVEGDQGWDKFYVEVKPAEWDTFTSKFRAMVE